MRQLFLYNLRAHGWLNTQEKNYFYNIMRMPKEQEKMLKATG